MKEIHEKMVKKLNTILITQSLIGDNKYSYIDLPALFETFILKNNEHFLQILSSAEGFIIAFQDDFGTTAQTKPEEDLDKFLNDLDKYVIK